MRLFACYRRPAAYGCRISLKLLVTERCVDLHLDPDEMILGLDDKVHSIRDISDRAEFGFDPVALSELLAPFFAWQCGIQNICQEAP